MTTITNYNSHMENLINSSLKSGKKVEASTFYEMTKEFLNSITNNGSGVCNCDKVIRHPNGGEVKVHICGAGFFDRIKSAINIGKTAYDSNKKIFDYASKEVGKKIGGEIDNTIPQKRLKLEGFGFGWGRSDIGNTDKLVNWAQQGLQTAEEVGKLMT
jgi:hypothetical protein